MAAEGAPSAAAAEGAQAAPGEAAAAAPAAAPAAKPVGGFKLGLIAIWGIIKNFFRKLFGGGKPKTSA